MATYTNVINIESFFIRQNAPRIIRSERGFLTYDLLEGLSRYGVRTALGGDSAINAPRTAPIEFWWEHENINGFIVNKPMIQVTPSNVSTDKVTVRITNWGDSDEQLYAVTPL